MKVSIQQLFPYTLVLLYGLAVGGCALMNKGQTATTAPAFYNAGHRGTRGLMPENTIPAMEKGIRVGANTCEMDIQVTKDGKVVLNHDVSLNPEYVTMPDGTEIPQAERDRYMIYHMDYTDLRRFIVGEKPYPRFPEQQRIKTHVPLFTALIDSVEAFTRRNDYAPVYYMPEIKSNPDRYGTGQPYPEEFVKTVMRTLKPYMKKIGKRLIFQASDMKPLQILHRDYPNIQLALLPRKKGADITALIKELGFKPDFYLPRYRYVTPELLNTCHKLDIKVVPWTPDDPKAMRKLVVMGVDGIITNYPDRLTTILKEVK